MTNKEKIMEFVKHFDLELNKDEFQSTKINGNTLLFEFGDWVVNKEMYGLFYDEIDDVGRYRILVAYKTDEEWDLESHLYQFEKDKENGTLAES